ncbi:hypothetical protein ACEE90_01460 [Corynebacterium phoceense]|uniref:hypothetical protein n=1 Tax=Corynebacterium phoceense TaxID=1686286 RepID=UPI0034CF1C41
MTNPDTTATDTTATEKTTTKRQTKTDTKPTTEAPIVWGTDDDGNRFMAAPGTKPAKEAAAPKDKPKKK